MDAVSSQAFIVSPSVLFYVTESTLFCVETPVVFYDMSQLVLTAKPVWYSITAMTQLRMLVSNTDGWDDEREITVSEIYP